MVEPTWLGSVSIHKEEWGVEDGGPRRIVGGLARPYAFTIPLLLGNASAVSVGFMWC